MMRTAGARIMSISGARPAQTSPGLPADAHDAGFWGAKIGGTTARCTNSRCPHLAQPLNIYIYIDIILVVEDTICSFIRRVAELGLQDLGHAI